MEKINPLVTVSEPMGGAAAPAWQAHLAAIWVAAEILGRTHRNGDVKAIALDLVGLGIRFVDRCSETEMALMFRELHPERSVDVVDSDDSSEEHF